MTLLERIPNGARFAVIRLRSLGDCVLTTPALDLLRAHRPDLRVSVVVEDRFRAVFEGTGVELLTPSRREIFRWRPDAVLNFHGGTRSMALAIASRAPIRAGFGHHPYSFVYTHKIPRAQEILGEERPVHTAEHLASAMFWMGVPQQEIPRARLNSDSQTPPNPAVMIHPSTSSRVGHSGFTRYYWLGQSKPHVVIHPFASRPDKAWPTEKFLECARQLRGLDVVFLAGPGDDLTPFEGHRALANAPLEEVKATIAGASLFLGNDSGPAHIAAAFGVPVVVLFGPSNPVTWAPWRTENRILTASAIDQITVADVLAAAEALRVRV